MANRLSKEAQELFTADNIDNETIAMENQFTAGEEVPSDEDALALSILDSNVSDAALLERQASLYLSQGLYIWKDGKVTVKLDFDDTDKALTDLAQKKGIDKGRLIINVNGVVVAKEGNRSGRFNFQMSPDIRKQGGELDFRSQNYGKAEDYFFKKYERKQQKETEIVALLQSAEYVMYITYSAKSSRNYLGNFQPLK